MTKTAVMQKNIDVEIFYDATEQDMKIIEKFVKELVVKNTMLLDNPDYVCCAKCDWYCDSYRVFYHVSMSKKDIKLFIYSVAKMIY